MPATRSQQKAVRPKGWGLTLIELQLCRANSCGPPGQEAGRTQRSHMTKALGRDPRVG